MATRNLLKYAGQSLNRQCETRWKTFPTEEVVEDMTRELDMVKSFPMYQTLPQAEAPGTVWSGRWCCRREEPKQVRARFVVRPFAISLGAAFYSSTPGLEVMRVLFVTAPLKDITV